MKEHPIIFSTEMVRAILDGRKTQTRRVIKPQPYDTTKYIQEPDEWRDYWVFGRQEYDQSAICLKCPYGQVGDRLWVRESFWIEHETAWDVRHGNIIDCGIDVAEASWAEVRYCATDVEPKFKVYSKRPSIHMPRWASRIDLDITGIRVERLQEISEEDAIAEGITLIKGTHATIIQNDNGKYSTGEAEPYTHKYLFEGLWDTINAKRGYSWESNPWVWVLEFKRLSPVPGSTHSQ